MRKFGSTQSDGQAKKLINRLGVACSERPAGGISSSQCQEGPQRRVPGGLNLRLLGCAIFKPSACQGKIIPPKGIARIWRLGGRTQRLATMLSRKAICHSLLILLCGAFIAETASGLQLVQRQVGRHSVQVLDSSLFTIFTISSLRPMLLRCALRPPWPDLVMNTLRHHKCALRCRE